jgi:vacuolar-type H+-ATPase subunit E/Vma4
VSALGSVEAVVAAIHEDARDELLRIERDAAAAIDRLRFEDAAAPVAAAGADARILAARRRAREQAAAEDWSDREDALNARERWTAAVVEEGMRRLLASPDDVKRADLLAFAREAIARLPAGACELLVSPQDLPLLDHGWRAQLNAHIATPASVRASAAIAGGCVAQRRDGRIRFDNSYAARARRDESRWRTAIGTLFDAATAGAAHV